MTIRPEAISAAAAAIHAKLCDPHAGHQTEPNDVGDGSLNCLTCSTEDETAAYFRRDPDDEDDTAAATAALEAGAPLLLTYEDAHRIAVARELTYAACCPLRDRYGFAASDETVLHVVNIVFGTNDDEHAGDLIGCANYEGTIQVAEGYDTPASKEYEQKIIAALRVLVEDRRRAAARAAEHV